MTIINTVSSILAGFSIVSSCILLAVYLFSLPDMQKTRFGRLACTVLLSVLVLLQVGHLIHFSIGYSLLAHRGYALLLSLVPVSLFFFSEELLFHRGRFEPKYLAHSLLVIVVLLVPLKWAPLASFAAGCGYTFYIFTNILKLRDNIPRFRFERFFFGLFFAMTCIALALGMILPQLDTAVFYHAYAGCISIAFVLVVSALLIFPDLLSDVMLATETVYAQTKLGNIDVLAKQRKLEQLMKNERCFENENLTLTLVAEQLELNAHQLSELVNKSFGTSFPRYVQRHRVEAARQMLLTEPDASVLSVGLANGFKSQSSFYTAFKTHTGYTPAGYRKSQEGL